MPRLISYTTDHAAFVTQVPANLLREWENEEIVQPRSSYLDPRGERHSLYAFADLVDISALWWLRSRLQASRATLKIACRALAAFEQAPWLTLSIDSPGTLVISSVAMETRIPLDTFVSSCAGEFVRRVDIEQDCESRTAQLLERKPDQIGRVEQKPDVRNGQPVLAGTRIPTIAIQEFHDAGYSVAEILEQYPRLTSADIDAALAFEAELRIERKAS